MTFAYENEAKSGMPMPEGLTAAEQIYYQALALLSARYRYGAISAEDSVKEKRLLEKEYANMAAKEKYITHVAHLWVDAESAAIAFGNNPSVENGHKMYEAIYGCVLKNREANADEQ